MTRIPNAKEQELQAECDRFNESYPVGTEVLLKKDFVDEPVRTRTWSEASVLSGHSAVVWLEGVSGCYLLDRVTPVVESAA